MSKRKENVSISHGMGGLKGRDGLLLGVKWLCFTTLGRILSTVMSYPIFFIISHPYSSPAVPNFSETYFLNSQPQNRGGGNTTPPPPRESAPGNGGRGAVQSV